MAGSSLKRVITICCALILTFSVTACAPSAPKPNPDGESAKPKSESGVEAAKKTTVTWLQWKKNELGEEKFNKVMNAFYAKFPNITVDVQDLPFDQVHDKIMTLNSAGTPPDVVIVNSPWYVEFAHNDIVMPLDDYYNTMPDDFKNNVKGPLWSEYNGKHYALPFDTGTIALFYNKKLLKEANINPPTTWEELEAAAVKLTNPAKGQYAFTGNMQTEPPTCITYEVWPFMLQAGAKLVSNNTAVFNSPEGVAGLEFYKKLLKDKKVMTPGELTAGEKEKRANFSAGNIAFMFEGPWGVGIQQSANPDLEFGVVPMPKGKTTGTIVSGGGIGITSKSKNKDAAWDFISFLGGEGQKVLAEVGIFPPNRAAFESPVIQDDQYMKVFAEAFNGNAVNPDLSMPQSDELRKLFTVEVQNYITGKKTAQQALDDAAASWNKIFAQYK